MSDETTPQDGKAMSPASAGSRGCNPNARLIVSGSPTIDEYRTALAGCEAEKAADWKAACESAELASKEINRLRLTDEELKAIRRATAVAREMHDSRLEAALGGLLERLG